jgi:hypothetical protein
MFFFQNVGPPIFFPECAANHVFFPECAANHVFSQNVLSIRFCFTRMCCQSCFFPKMC